MSVSCKLSEGCKILEKDTVNLLETYSTELRINNAVKKLRTNAKLEIWLKQLTDHSMSPLEDPRYSRYYKSYFGNVSQNGYIYDTSNNTSDIDIKLNLGYYRYSYQLELEMDNKQTNINIDKHPEDVVVEQFIDTVVDKNGFTHDIVIPPGTNQSNANFLFKIFRDIMAEAEPSHIPIVSSDKTVRYTGGVKHSSINLPKIELYQFLMDRSNQKRKLF